MTNDRPPRDWPRTPVSHPPEAILYLQLSSRRRAVGALLLGAGLALAAAVIAFGNSSQEAWPVVAAVAGTIAGLLSTRIYRRHARLAQTAEDRVRATALVGRFDGRLDCGRLALTNAGVELDGESFAWASIHRIDSTLAEAMSKRATLVLDAAHANRRVPVSLAGLAEQPAVVYAVMKMLWMRQVTAHDIAEFLPRGKPRRSELSPVKSTLGTLWSMLGVLAIPVGTFVTLKLLTAPHPWLAALSAGIAIVVFVWAISQSEKANWREAARGQDRAAQLETSLPGTGEFELRRKRVIRWPTIITVLFAAPALIFIAMGDGPLATSFLVSGSIVSLIAWITAWSMGTGVIATLTPTGIVLRGEEIPWRDVTSLDVHYVPRIGTGQLVIRLARARAPRTLGERINSSLSAGHSDVEIVVSLARSMEPPGAILRLAEMRWESAIGTQRFDDALSRQIEERVRETRTWSRFSAAEKTRSLRVFAAMFALLGFAAHGMFADFRPADSWVKVSLALSAVITVWGVVALLRARVLLSVRHGQGTPSYIALFFILSLVVGAMIWSTIGHSWADLVTRSFGREVTRDVTYEKSGYRDRDSCPFPLAIRLDANRPYRFCAEPAAYDSLPQAGTLRLELRESWFGVHIVRVSTIEN